MERLIKSALFIFLFSFFYLPVSGDPLDAAAQKALEQTQSLLNDPALRAKYSKDSPAAAQASAQAEILVGSAQNSRALFALSSEVMAEIVRKTNGDPDAMAKLLALAESNPERFARQLSPELQTQIRELAKRLPNPTALNKIP